MTKKKRRLINRDWAQIIAVFLANASLILWFHAESRNDWKHMDSKLDTTVQAIHADIQAIHVEMKDFHHTVQEELKDFHGRLCTIEERHRDK